eukprot:gene6817-7586_t
MVDFQEISKLDEEIEKLKSQIGQEEEDAEMLEQSVVDLKSTVKDLAAELDNIEDHESDVQWKERCDEQLEMNSYLEKQISILNEKLKELKEELSSSESKNDPLFEINDYNEVELRRLIKQFERERRELSGTLKDLEWQLDTESKACFRINADITEYKTELAQNLGKAAMLPLGETRKDNVQKKLYRNIKYDNFKESRHAPNDRYYGIPDNQRIIDPRKGPVKKTAVAGHLPKINSRSGKSSVKSSPGPQKSESSKSPRAYSSAKEDRNKYSV